MFSIFTEVMKNVLPKTHAHMERQGVLVDMYVGVSFSFFAVVVVVACVLLFNLVVCFFSCFFYFENLEGGEQM